MAEWFGALASLAHAVMRGVWVRAPSLLGHTALPTTGGIGDMSTQKFLRDADWK